MVFIFVFQAQGQVSALDSKIRKLDAANSELKTRAEHAEHECQIADQQAKQFASQVLPSMYAFINA